MNGKEKEMRLPLFLIPAREHTDVDFRSLARVKAAFLPN